MTKRPTTTRQRGVTVNPRYHGYLKPHAKKIQRLANDGKSPTQIGRILYADGVRSPYDPGPDANGHCMDHARSFAALVYVVLGRRPKTSKEVLRRRIARAQQKLRELERRARP